MQNYKQRRQEQYHKLRKLGIPSKDAKKYSSYSADRFATVLQSEKKRISEEKRRERYERNKEKYNAERRRKYNESRSKGLTSEQAKRYRSKKQQEIDTVTPEKADNTEYLIIGYREYSHGDDPEGYYYMKEIMKTRSSKQLESDIRENVEAGSQGGFIGDHRMDIVQGGFELRLTKDLYEELEYIPVYVGEGKNLQPLLSLINLMTSLMYSQQILKFIFDLVANLRMMKNDYAKKNAEYIQKNIMMFFKGKESI